MKTEIQTRTAVWQSPEDINAVRTKLSGIDPVLAVAHHSVDPFQWDVRQNGFAGLIQLITEQQISTTAAAAIWRRFQEGVGEVTSANLRTYDTERLRSLGLSRPKALYVQAIAEAEASGAIDFASLAYLEDEQAIEKLTELKGVGRWTAEVYLMFCEGRTDLFPAGDLGLQEGFRLAARHKNRPSEKVLYERAESWRPYRGIAANLLWSYYTGVKSGKMHVPDSIKTVAAPKSRPSTRRSS